MKKLPPLINIRIALLTLTLSFSLGHVITQAQQTTQFDPKTIARFEAYDENQDEAVSLDEFLDGVLAGRGDNRGALEEKFENMDLNGDGVLNLSEYADAKKIRDDERIRKGKVPPTDESEDQEESPTLVTTVNKNGSRSGSWESSLLGRSLDCTVRYPATTADSYPVVVYLKGLPSPRAGTLSDKTLIKGFLNEGMMVIEVDYEGDMKAIAPDLLPEIDDWYGFLNETQEYSVDNSWIYILPAGHTIDRKVRICDVDGTTVDMDVIYPSGEADPVPLMLQITSIKDTGFWINQRAYYIYGLLTAGYAGAIMEHNGGTQFSPKGLLFPEKRAARLLRAEAEKWNLSGQLAVTGHSKGSSRAAKSAFLNDGEREGDPGPNVDQSDRFQAVLLSAGQHATEYLIEDGFLDEVGEAKREAALKQFEEMTLEEMLEISTTTYVTPDDPPAFLCVGEQDKTFRVNQMTRLARKCREVGLEHRFVIQPDMPHQYIDDPEVIGRIFRFLDRHLK